MARMAAYEALLLKWQKAINLVGPATLDDVVTRHFFDSAQLFRFMPDADVRLVDMGSGAGFPGLVLAMLGVRDVHLVESDVRKATFLREVSRETKTPVTVHDVRIEDCGVENPQVFTARALAPLRDLLAHMDALSAPEVPAYGLFLKGIQYQEELDKAKKQWNFEAEVFPSLTDLSAKIIKISKLNRR